MIASDIMQITLDRGPCFGPCPVFRFTAYRYGTYYYEGRWHVEPLGLRNGRFPRYLFDRLAEVCTELRVLELDNHYSTDFEDTASTILTVRYSGGAKTIQDEGGGLMPVRLWAFTTLVQVSMEQVFAVEELKVKKLR